nr:sulfotransferase [Haloactinopolyspora sp.]
MFSRRRRSKIPGPVFVGGTGRSGTTIMASLLGEHSAYHLIPIEARFHTEAAGFVGLTAGKVTPEQFRESMLGHYFHRTVNNGSARGLHLAGVQRDTLESAVERYLKKYQSDSAAAGADLMSSIFDPLVEQSQAHSWVEMTPPNVEQAAQLQRMFPDSRLIHIVRDGRDVAVSVASKSWGPNDPFAALEWWGTRLRRAEKEPAQPGYVMLVGFEALMDSDREGQFNRICEFLEISPEESMRAFFNEKMTTERARIGRWRRNVPEADHDRFEQAYREVVEKLRADGISSVEVLTT